MPRRRQMNDITGLIIAEQGNGTLPLLQRELEQTERGIENTLNAIQQGVLNRTIFLP